MASPLLAFANARIRVESSGTTTKVNGRFVTANTTFYMYLCYLKRVQYTGVSSGSRKVPLPTELNGEMMPGASGDSFYYRGYALQVTTLDDKDDWLDDITTFSMANVASNQSILVPESKVLFKFGAEEIMTGTIQRSTGIFGGDGIDNLIYPEIGLQLQITGAEVL